MKQDILNLSTRIEMDRCGVISHSNILEKPARDMKSCIYNAECFRGRTVQNRGEQSKGGAYTC